MAIEQFNHYKPMHYDNEPRARWDGRAVVQLLQNQQQQQQEQSEAGEHTRPEYAEEPHEYFGFGD